MAKESVTLTDNRTGRSCELPIVEGAVRASGLHALGLVSYDPAFMNTASTRSSITYIDGDNGLLWYRGYPIEQLAEGASFLEVAYLLVYGELPAARALEEWTWQITHHTWVHENVKKFMDGFHPDAHPMSMLISSVAALSTFYPDAKLYRDPGHRMLQIYRLIAKTPTLAAFAFRHALGRPYVQPDNDLTYAGNFLSMVWKMSELKYKPDPALERALDMLFVLHADHEQNCSTNAMRAVASSGVDPYSAVAAAAAALYGPLHGGANEAVLRMLRDIGGVGRVGEFVRRVKAGEAKLMGFGHRVYKNYDPRARIVKRAADGVFAATRPSALLPVALELERIALQDEYFVTRRLYPNVDFYTGLIYEAMGFPVEMFPVLFAVPRTVGWLAQWQEMIGDTEQKIARPRQLYVGPARRDFVPLGARP
ncbi:MAG TPA: citrate synthase [Methylomirabilota bacterium]|jgi:citrate synthase|nr:citrate synthase [Methylomirabilota bacterium]